MLHIHRISSLACIDFPNRFSTARALNWVTRGQPPIRIPGAAPWGAASSLTGATGGHVVEGVDSDVTASFIQEL